MSKDNQTRKVPTLMCHNCESQNIECDVWVNANTGKVTDWDGPAGEFRCNKCNNTFKYPRSVYLDELKP